MYSTPGARLQEPENEIIDLTIDCGQIQERKRVKSEVQAEIKIEDVKTEDIVTKAEDMKTEIEVEAKLETIPDYYSICRASMTVELAIPSVPPEVLSTFSLDSRACIQRLIAHCAEHHDLSVHPRTKLGAVLVLLYEHAGELRVLLTTRSKSLRTHPGQTALPGGRVDSSDRNFIETAYREAYEEVGLPLDSPHVHTVAVLEPFISLYKIVVTPVVAVLTCPSLLDELKAQASEVECIFTHPLRALLDPSLARSEPLVERGTEDWPYEEDLYNTSDTAVPLLGNMVYRMHRFRSSASPIKGLTADILIKTAQIAYDSETTYPRYACGQLQTFGEISRWVVESAAQH
ncbi:putative NUDIX domain containing protein [Lyophyllum shimeji]|uniref:NUDIX domain containing protein n=1 Tax=Lyophyllum shimeji TaxID=47721 RepID=A0A9P3PSF8_LYOSH|nr:putative NUDIX domain containing protein [Lyophyllum shimeji]